MRRVPWNIPREAGLYPLGRSYAEISLKSSHLSAKVHNTTSHMSYSQVFVNSSSFPVEAVYRFPVSHHFSVTGVTIKTSEKEIQAQIMEKKEAEQKYEDAVAAGHTAAKLNYDEHIPEVLELAIGAVQPHKQVEVVVQMVAKCELIKCGLYSFIFPLSFIPKYQESEFEGYIQPKAEGDYIPGEFSAKIEIEANDRISNVQVSNIFMEKRFSNGGKSVTCELHPMKNRKGVDLVVSFATETIRKPQITLHSSDKQDEKVVAHISWIPKISKYSPCSSQLEESKASDSTYENSSEGPEICSGEYIFLLDRSGSMGFDGNINLALKTLKLFVQSLPSDCMFNIIGFGTEIDMLWRRGSQEYTQSNLKKAVRAISYMSADLGGTDLHSPLEEIFQQPVNSKYPRNVFILTDGAIMDTEKVIKLVEDNNHSTRVHAFGIGSGASKYLVEEVSRAGLGTCAMFQSGASHINAKVIKTLENSARPALTDIKLHWGENMNAVHFHTPRAPTHTVIYEEGKKIEQSNHFLFIRFEIRIEFVKHPLSESYQNYLTEAFHML